MQKNTFKYVYWDLPESYDPHKSDSFASMPVAKNIYSPLVSTFLGGKPQGLIAESWKISSDGKTWRFKIRKGIKFADGTPITAQIVYQNFKRILWLTKESGLILNLAMPEIAKWNDYSRPPKCFEVEGDELVFRFKFQPASLFESLEKPLYGIAHPDCFNDAGAWNDKLCLNESGQYRVEQRLADRIILKNRHVFPEVQNAPETVEFISAVPKNTTRIQWSMDNKVDILLYGTLNLGKHEAKIVADSGYKVLPEPPLHMHFLRLNHKRPPFSDKALRQSIRDTFLSLLAADPNFTSENELSHSFIPPGGMGYIDIKTPKQPAKRPNLKGVEISALLLPKAPPEKPEFKIDKLNKALEDAIIKTMELHGIRLNISRDYTQTYERTKSGYYDLMIKGSGLSVQEPYEALRMMFMSDVGACIPDPSGKIPALIMKGQFSSDPGLRRTVAEKINGLIFDEAAAITFAHSGFLYIYSPAVDVSGISTFSDPVEFRAIARNSQPE